MGVAAFFSRGWRHRIFAVVVVPTAFYTLFYNFDYCIINSTSSIVMAYGGAVYICLLYLFLASFKMADVYEAVPRRVCLKTVLLFVLQYIAIIYATAIPWAIDTFPMSNIEAVLFTLFAGANEGAEEFVLSSIVDGVIFPSIKIFLVVIIIQVAFACALTRVDKGVLFTLWKIRYFFCPGPFKRCLFFLQKGMFVFIALYCLALSLVLPGIVLSAPFRALFQIPVDSELYRNYYVHPDSLKLESPENLKNLIVVMMESMETNFERETPEIAKLQNENSNFAPGGVSVAGTSWTIAGITGKLCGIPLNMPMGITEYLGKLPTYLPGARCIMEMLRNLGYNQEFLQGSRGDFTQINDFCKWHGDVALHDLDFYRDNGSIPKDYKVFWGYEDRKLYEFAKKDLDSLSLLENPFALYMFTIDTHQPAGYVDAQCEKDFANIADKYPKALHCASKQLDDFIEWAKLQPWYENTVISVMGDHTMQMLSSKAGVPVSDSLYWTNFIINSVINTPVRERQYSSLDMFPTLLEAMGFKLQNRSAGLGRSLYSDSLTMLELYGRHTLDSLLRERSIQYDEFLFGKKK